MLHYKAEMPAKMPAEMPAEMPAKMPVLMPVSVTMQGGVGFALSLITMATISLQAKIPKLESII